MKNKIMFFYDRFEEIVSITLFAILVVVIFLQVVMRYVFNSSPSWAEELGKYVFVWLSWIGVSLGARYGEHIKITLLTQKLSFRSSHICNIVSDVIVIAICAVTLHYGIIVCDMLLNVNIMNSALKINQAWGHAAVPVGCGLMILRSLQSMFDSIRKLKGGGSSPANPAASAVEGGNA